MPRWKSRREIRIQRAYEPPERRDSVRVLVDRLWPRGVKKERAAIDEHMKEVAPSTELRKWFGHDPSKWDEFRRRYERELDGKPDQIAHLAHLAEGGDLTLVYAARDSERNDAVVLRDYLLRVLRRRLS